MTEKPINIEGRVQLSIPEDWSLDSSTQPLVLSVPKSDVAIQISWLPTESKHDVTPGYVQTKVLDVISFWQKQHGAHEARSTVAVEAQEYATDDGSFAVWADVPSRVTSIERAFSVGRRDWLDGALMITWIGEDQDLPLRNTARKVFESAARV